MAQQEMHGTHARFLPSSASRPIMSDSASSDKRPLPDATPRSLCGRTTTNKSSSRVT